MSSASVWGRRLQHSGHVLIDLDVSEVQDDQAPYEARNTSRTGQEHKQQVRSRSRARSPRRQESARVYKQLSFWEVLARRASSSSSNKPPASREDEQAPDSTHDERVIAVLSQPIEEDAAGIDFVPPRNVYDICPVNSPDALACSWLMSGRVTFKQLRRLFDFLPTIITRRHQAPHITTTTEARAIHFGAWVHGGNIGLTTSCAPFPNVVKLLCRILHTLHPQGYYSTVFLAMNVPSGVHSDPHNHSEVENILVPLSKFTGGELFVADKHGSFKLDSEGLTGSITPITLPYTSFWARRKHAVLPWQGDRFLLGSYQVRNSEWLKASDKRRLEELGMKLWQ